MTWRLAKTTPLWRSMQEQDARGLSDDCNRQNQSHPFAIAARELDSAVNHQRILEAM